MSFSEIILDGLKYPFKDLKKFFILAILFFIPSIFSIIISFLSSTGQFNFSAILLSLIAFIALVVVSFFTSGYSFSVTKNTIEKNEDVPIFQPVLNLVNGIKIFIVEFVYLIIFSIISLILIIIPFIIFPSSGDLFKNLEPIVNQISQNPTLVNDSYNQILPILTSYIDTHILDLVIISCFILIILVIGLIALFSYIIGLGRFAETGELTAFFKFKEIFKKISAIGKLKFLGLIIVTYLINFIIVAIFSIIGLIPIGSISIGAILVIIESPYLLFFQSRIYGLIYNEGELETDEKVSYDILE
jgi:hypothetical protein